MNAIQSRTENPDSMRRMLAIVLSVCLGLFLLDASLSLVDASLILWIDSHLFSQIRALVVFLSVLISLGVYALMGLTPMVPKRIFLPVVLFHPVAVLALYPFAIYHYGQLRQVALGISACQLVLGGFLLVWAQGGVKCRGALVPVARLNPGRFSWLNLGGFALVNAVVVFPAVIGYVFFCSALAVDHFTDGFMALNPNGFSVQARKYVRDDGKTIELFPMAHVADAAFYRRMSQAFPPRAIILMEGVTDNQNLLSDSIRYARMAEALGLVEQKEAFAPKRGVRVRADVDVSQFSPDTIQLLNLAIRIHAQGLTPENVAMLKDQTPSVRLQETLITDLLRNRNRHLLGEIRSYLAQADQIVVPWGAAHMPGISKEIEMLGFRLVERRDTMVIRFFGSDKQG